MSLGNLKDEQLKALEKTDGYNQACALIKLIEKEGFEAYLVGGCVRDVLLGRELKDFDMCTSAPPEQMKKIFKDFKLLLQGEAFGTVAVVVDKNAFEITTYRGDGVYSNSRHPDEVKFSSSLKEDLQRRDFTINALAFHPLKGVVDLVGGLKDVNLKILRTVGEPRTRFDEDALRIARLVRFAVQLGFDVEEKSLEAAILKAPLLRKISKERVYAEFKKMLVAKPEFKIFDQIFKTSFVPVFGFQKRLSLFEKAYVGLELCKALGVSNTDYILEKPLRDRCASLRKISSSCELKSDFIKLCDKYDLYGEDMMNLWSLVSLIRPEAREWTARPFSKKDVASVTQDLKGEHQGKELGAAIFESKLKMFFLV